MPGRSTTREQYDLVLSMRAAGARINDIALAADVHRCTVRAWLIRPPEHLVEQRARISLHELGAAYSYLLGLYLGDGTLSRTRKPGLLLLRIFQDERYTELITECAQAIEAVSRHRAGTIRREGCIEIHASWKQWLALFPQHGPGRKHERPIYLADWQAEVVDRFPKPLIRGLIQSDGCRVLNNVPRGKRPYPRYHFSNRSQDIHAIYHRALDRLGVHWTRPSLKDTSVARRADVEFLDTFVGPKTDPAPFPYDEEPPAVTPLPGLPAGSDEQPG
jgi:hypothetical protein